MDRVGLPLLLLPPSSLSLLHIFVPSFIHCAKTVGERGYGLYNTVLLKTNGSFPYDLFISLENLSCSHI
ncbi:hypothetical protein LENED_011034 [Lentinula edodes]|uniref:Secreted protein n=1 Tax=Lentinula edodes TaxID=5353 RepID=A0A1Q3EP05_LENED|nr:hypothetical protein LENED_011034 [Lentinula edodes]